MDRNSVLMKIMLLGSNGQLGKELERELSTVGSLNAFPRSALDITNHQSVLEAVGEIQPDIIVNAAAYTEVDKAESDAEQAFAVNAEAVANLAQIAAKERAWLIHYSTDYVFDGSKPTPYLETDTPNPINIYGASKFEGERKITSVNDQYLVLRTSWVIGRDNNNFAKTILRLAAERDSLKVINDQLGVPTSPSLISKTTINAISAIKRKMAWPPGIYHLAPLGVSSWYEIAKTLIAYAEQQRVHLNIQVSDLQAITSAEYPTAAKRPLNSQLNAQKLQSLVSFDLPHWKDDFLAVARDIVKELETI